VNTPALFLAGENDVLSGLFAVEAGSNVIARPACRGFVRKLLAADFQFVDVTGFALRPICAAYTRRCSAIRFGEAG
jgi:hypothetical protein